MTPSFLLTLTAAATGIGTLAGVVGRSLPNGPAKRLLLGAAALLPDLALAVKHVTGL